MRTPWLVLVAVVGIIALLVAVLEDRPIWRDSLVRVDDEVRVESRGSIQAVPPSMVEDRMSLIPKRKLPRNRKTDYKEPTTHQSQFSPSPRNQNGGKN